MAQIDYIDYSNKRIHLHADTVTNGFDCIAAHFEISQRIIANQNGEQNHPHMLKAEGNIPKGGGKFTPRYGLLSTGWKFVPYGGVGHILKILVEPISEDGYSGRETFDRLPINVQVDIDEIYEKIEIREINTGSGITQQDKLDIANLTDAILADNFQTITNKTDQLTFTKANELDVNVKSQNDAKLYGSGIDTDKWRGTP